MNVSNTNYLDVPKVTTENNVNDSFLSQDFLNPGNISRRPSILPVPDMFSSSTTLNLCDDQQDETGDENENDDEVEDEVPWRSPSEKIA